MRKYDKVRVSPEATGLGTWTSGWVDEVSFFMNRVSVSVRYDQPDANGATGIVINNIGMLEKISEDPEMDDETLKKRLDKCIDAYQLENPILRSGNDKIFVIERYNITLYQLKRLSEEFGDDAIAVFPGDRRIKVYIENNKKTVAEE